MSNRIAKLVNGVLTPFGVKLTTIKPSTDTSDYYQELVSDDSTLTASEREARRVRNVLAYTKTSASAYSAQAFDTGYHSITVAGQEFSGQRNPASRLREVPFDFSGKIVLDLGSNQGGMLFALADQISLGIGVDYDGRMINAANRVRASRQDLNLHFYVFNLETENLAFLDNYFLSSLPDIVFLLSICMWISNWRDVIDFAHSRAPAMLFESNGSIEQQAEQEQHLRLRYAKVQQLASTSPDDPLQSARSLYLCTSH